MQVFKEVLCHTAAKARKKNSNKDQTLCNQTTTVHSTGSSSLSSRYLVSLTVQGFVFSNLQTQNAILLLLLDPQSPIVDLGQQIS